MAAAHEVPLKKEVERSFNGECIYQSTHPEKIDDAKNYIKCLLKYRIPISNLISHSFEEKYLKGKEYNIKSIIENISMYMNQKIH